jgi:hypothetical protein
MNTNNSSFIPDVNQLIIEKLKLYPPAVSELALKAIQLEENNMPEGTVLDQLRMLTRDAARKYGDEL